MRLECGFEHALPIARAVAMSEDGARIRQVTALIDTGSSSSVLSDEVARILSLDRYTKRDVRTVSGDVRLWATRFRLGSSTDEAGLRSLDRLFPAAIAMPVNSPEGGRPFDVIIGMDVISLGKLTVDSGGALLELT